MSDRTSRQALVVPQKRSNGPLLFGAIASGCTGFVAVWVLGLGRMAGQPSGEPSPWPPVAAAAAPDVSAEQAVEPNRFSPAAGDAARSTTPPDAPGTTDRYADRYSESSLIQPLSSEQPDGVMPTAGSSPPRSRFASSEEPVTELEAPAEPEATPASQTTPSDLPAAGESAADADAPASPPTEIEQPLTATVTESEPATSAAAEPDPVAENLVKQHEPDDATAAVPNGQLDSQPLPEDVGDLAAQPQAFAAQPQAFAAQPQAFAAQPQATPPPAAAGSPPGGFSRDIDAPAAFPRAAPAADPEAPIPHHPGALLAAAVPVAAVAGNPLRARQPSAAFNAAAAAVPFAAAPPIAPGALAGVPPVVQGQPFSSSATALPSADGGSTGQGRPGPMQLEGVQTPQLSVEKRGPREVQVGKAARYEILVRNVGSATAHDCTLRDSVPYGTSLIATTPPASPANPATAANGSGDLIWLLGSLPPGGQARVAMEVMPTTEGDVGSVASVTFRADASVRSRATKPDLRIEASDPKPVLIGKDVNVSIKIANPGTGVATGVVLEGALPEQLIHKAGRDLEFDVGQLQPGGSRTLDLALGSMGPGVHNVRLVARADGQIEVEHMLRIEVTAPTLELAVEMPARRYLQRPATCVISMANTGTAPAKGVELAAQLPRGMKFVRANNAGYYDERGHRVLWNLEELPAAETGSVEVVVMPIDLGPQKIVAAARSADGLSDQIAHTLEVEGLAAIFFEVTDSEDPIEVGGLTEYIVRIRNQGTKSASGVRLTAILLGEMEPVDAKGPAAHRIENLTVGFEPLAKLAPAEEAVFRIRARGHREGDQRMQVQLTSDDHQAPITKEEITRVYSDR